MEEKCIANIYTLRSIHIQILSLVISTFYYQFFVYQNLYEVLYGVAEDTAKLQVGFGCHYLGRPTWTSAPISVPLVVAVDYRQAQYLNVN